MRWDTLAEYGIVISKLGGSAVRRALAEILEDDENGLPSSFRLLLNELRSELESHDERLLHLNRQLDDQVKSDERVQRLMALEGVGPVTATALVASVGMHGNSRAGEILRPGWGLYPISTHREAKPG